jgi:S1-C subfamily serine protease
VFVELVFRESAAEKGGLQAGDCIVAVGAVEVESPAMLAQLIAGSKQGPTAITIMRGGKKMEISCVLPPVGEVAPDEQF